MKRVDDYVKINILIETLRDIFFNKYIKELLEAAAQCSIQYLNTAIKFHFRGKIEETNRTHEVSCRYFSFRCANHLLSRYISKLSN